MQKKVYVIDEYPYLTKNVAAITATDIYASKEKAQSAFNERLDELCNENGTAKRCSHGAGLIDMFTFKRKTDGRNVYIRLREMDLIQ